MILCFWPSRPPLHIRIERLYSAICTNSSFTTCCGLLFLKDVGCNLSLQWSEWALWEWLKNWLFYILFRKPKNSPGCISLVKMNSLSSGSFHLPAAFKGLLAWSSYGWSHINIDYCSCFRIFLEPGSELGWVCQFGTTLVCLLGAALGCDVLGEILYWPLYSLRRCSPSWRVEKDLAPFINHVWALFPIAAPTHSVTVMQFSLSLPLSHCPSLSLTLGFSCFNEYLREREIRMTWWAFSKVFYNRTGERKHVGREPDHTVISFLKSKSLYCILYDDALLEYLWSQNWPNVTSKRNCLEQSVNIWWELHWREGGRRRPLLMWADL